MILSSDELEVLEYLKSWKGVHVSLVEICRSAGGRRKYRESPHWAKGLMARLVDSNLVTVNERGHYSYIVKDEAPAAEVLPEAVVANGGVAVNAVEDYFPTLPEQSQIVGDDYFSPMEGPPTKKKKKIWVSPQMESILSKAGKKPVKAHQND
jgi:hypothetical protein